jgi:hypothetical protein
VVSFWSYPFVLVDRVFIAWWMILSYFELRHPNRLILVFIFFNIGRVHFIIISWLLNCSFAQFSRLIFIWWITYMRRFSLRFKIMIVYICGIKVVMIMIMWIINAVLKRFLISLIPLVLIKILRIFVVQSFLLSFIIFGVILIVELSSWVGLTKTFLLRQVMKLFLCWILLI